VDFTLISSWPNIDGDENKSKHIEANIPERLNYFGYANVIMASSHENVVLILFSSYFSP